MDGEYFNKNLKTVILIHGFATRRELTEKFKKGSFNCISQKCSLLFLTIFLIFSVYFGGQNDTTNLISVNWDDGAKELIYWKTASNHVPVVGDNTGEFLYNEIL